MFGLPIAKYLRVWTRSTSSSFQLIPYIYPAFIPFGRYFYSSFSLNPSKVRLLNDNFSFARTTCCLFILNSVHAQDVFAKKAILTDLNIVIRTIILFWVFFVNKSYLLQHNSVLIFILWRTPRKKTIILGMKKWRLG